MRNYGPEIGMDSLQVGGGWNIEIGVRDGGSCCTGQGPNNGSFELGNARRAVLRDREFLH
jgi:hypothetical protein